MNYTELYKKIRGMRVFMRKVKDRNKRYQQLYVTGKGVEFKLCKKGILRQSGVDTPDISMLISKNLDDSPSMAYPMKDGKIESDFPIVVIDCVRGKPIAIKLRSVGKQKGK